MNKAESKWTIRLVLILLALAALTLGLLDYFAILSVPASLTTSLQVTATIALVWVTVEYVERIEQQAEARDQSVQVLLHERRKNALTDVMLVESYVSDMIERVQSQLWYIDTPGETLGPPQGELFQENRIPALEARAGRIGGRLYESVKRAVAATRQVEKSRAQLEQENFSEDAMKSYEDSLRRAVEILPDVRQDALEAIEALREVDYVKMLTPHRD